jgi:6-phosphogluconolactonase (cycloisomerase 2 family)
MLVTANYAGGSVSVIPVAADGRLGARTALVALEGPLGPHRTEQATAHPHQCRFDRTGRVLAVPDKGLDRIFLFTLDAATGSLQPATPPSVTTRAGAGPRHVDFHPGGRHAYVVNELDSTVTTYRLDSPTDWVPLQIVSSIPPSFTGANTGSGIEVAHSGRFVFTSNRGHDSIAAFLVDGDGTLHPIGWTPSQGRTPRFFCQDPSGHWLYVANQATDTIVPFRVDVGTGSLSPAGAPIATGTPMAIVFAALRPEP